MHETLYDLMFFFTDPEEQEITIWDCNTEETLYEGLYGNMPDELNYATVMSIDTIYEKTKNIVFNVEYRTEE